jgi:broad specificity phosphatase PhoE
MRRVITIGLMVAVLALCRSTLAAEPWDALHQGGVLVVMRHADTEPGSGDPPGFRIEDCKTQRNLSAHGRVQAQRIGAMFAVRGVRPAQVFSSAWCRCVDTALLAFPSVPVNNLPALDSVFMDKSREPAQTAALREEMRRLHPTGVTVWVTHQTNMTALTGEYAGMGEALILRPDNTGNFRVLGRLSPPTR